MLHWVENRSHAAHRWPSTAPFYTSLLAPHPSRITVGTGRWDVSLYPVRKGRGREGVFVKSQDTGCFFFFLSVWLKQWEQVSSKMPARKRLSRCSLAWYSRLSGNRYSPYCAMQSQAADKPHCPNSGKVFRHSWQNQLQPFLKPPLSATALGSKVQSPLHTQRYLY